jgi:hypothetical protein
MRQIFAFALLAILGSCGSNKSEEKTASASSSAATSTSNSQDAAAVNYPLSSMYSHTWEAGDPKNTVTIMNIGKDWMESNFASFDKYFADSISMYLASGDNILAKRDNAITFMKDFRKMYSEVKSDIHSIIPLHHKETNDNWVCIWMKEITTSIKGKKDSVELQESWKLNKAGKVELVYQYAATIKPPTK